jgi:hypothetical protein
MSTPPDVILGADVVWLEDLVEPLVSTVRQLAGPGTSVYVAHQTRSQRVDDKFFELMREGFDVEECLHPNADYRTPLLKIWHFQRTP